MLRTSFWRALVASGIVISISLVACGLAPQLASRAMLGQTVLAAITVGALGCLLLYGILLRVMLSTTPEESQPSGR